jgi:Ni,Fe-hydrogenase I cytochrome b subunit
LGEQQLIHAVFSPLIYLMQWVKHLAAVVTVLNGLFFTYKLQTRASWVNSDDNFIVILGYQAKLVRVGMHSRTASRFTKSIPP